jgi:hypothetical protein
MNIPGELIPITLFLVAGFIVVFLPISRALARRADRQSLQPAVPPEIFGRLERIEQAVDAIAIEVERISEGQRFTTQLLSEGRQHAAAALPAAADNTGRAAPRG